MKKILLYFVALLLTFAANAQIPQYFCGQNTGANSIPFGGGSWADQRCQFLYLPGEFNAVPPKGFITTIYFRAANSSAVPSVTYSNLEIGFNQNTINTLGATWEAPITNCLVANAYTFTNVINGQWIAFTLQTPFYFDPALPLIVDTRQTGTTTPALPLKNFTPNPNTARRAWGASNATTASFGTGVQYDFGFDIFAGYPCTDTPKTEIAAPGKACPNDSFKVSPIKFYADATYKYQYSYDGVNWSNFVGTAGLYGEITDFINDRPKWYRCKIACIANPNAVHQTQPIKVDVAPFYHCYCKQKANVTNGTDIGNLTITAKPSDEIVLDNGFALPLFPNTKANRNYTPYMDSIPPVTFYRDSLYNFKVSIINSDNVFPTGYTAVFLDWNRDGLYDTVTERVMHKSTDLNGTATANFKIPANSEIGLTGMRAVLSNKTPVLPCESYGTGETEDYVANITWEPCNGPVNAGTILGDTSVCSGYDFLLTDSTYERRKSAFTRMWQISGDNIQWFYVAGSKDKDTLSRVFNGQPVYYRIEAICTPSKDTTLTPVHQVNLKAGYKCYCFSQAIGGKIKDSSDIGGFSLAAVSHQDGGTHLQNQRAIQKRSDYTDNTPIDMDIDSVYEMKIFHTQRTDIHGDAKVTIFMDFNNNHQYDIPEDLVFTGYTTVGNFTLVDSVKVKASAILNVATGLRVILNNDIAPNDPSDKACGVYTSGETEDYMITFRKKGFTGIGTVGDLTGLGIYPNPTTGKFTIQYKGGTNASDVKVTITNVTGQVVYSEHHEMSGGKFVKELDMSSHAKGVYFVELNTGTESVTRKLAVQ